MLPGQALTVDLKPGQREVQQTLVTPVMATALMVQYSAVWENLSEAAAEVLHCPRCSHTVVDVHGVCRYCRENAYQASAGLLGPPIQKAVEVMSGQTEGTLHINKAPVSLLVFSAEYFTVFIFGQVALWLALVTFAPLAVA